MSTTTREELKARIYKVTIPIDGKTHIISLQPRQFLSVGNQHGSVVMWFEANINQEPEERGFRVFLTGEELPELCKYIGTTSFDTPEISPFVAHLYQVPIEKPKGW